MEHAAGAVNLHGVGSYRCCRCVSTFLSRRTRLPHGPIAHPDTDVPEALRGRTSDHFPNAYTRSILVHTPRSDPLVSGAWNPDDSHLDCSVRAVHGASRLEVGRVRLGLRFGVGTHQRP